MQYQGNPYKYYSAVKGFTLIELVMVIIILSIVSVGIGDLVGKGTQAYVDTAERDEILSKSRYSVERLNRAIRYALPNSLRVEAYRPTGQTVKSHCLEYFPIEWSTFYTKLNTSQNGSDPHLEGPELVSALNTSDSGYDETEADSHYAVVYPTDPAQVYTSVVENIGRIVGVKNIAASNTAGLRKVELDNRIKFEEESTVDRFYIVSDPVSYCLVLEDGSYNLYLLKDYGILETQIADVDTLTNSHSAIKILMAEDLNNNISTISSSVIDNTGRGFDEAPFRIDDANLQRNSIVHTLLMFERNEQVVVFNNEIHLRNSP